MAAAADAELCSGYPAYSFPRRGGVAGAAPRERGLWGEGRRGGAQGQEAGGGNGRASGVRVGPEPGPGLGREGPRGRGES